MAHEALRQADADAVAKLMDNDGNLTPHFQVYIQYEDTYQSKVEARNMAYSAACTNPMQLQQWPQDGVVYQADIDAAWERWMGLGFKLEIETALDTLAAQGADLALALIDQAKERFRNSLHDLSSNKAQ